jgi:hypothetical protein
MVTNGSKDSVSIGTARCCKGKAIHNSESVSLRKQCVSESTPAEEVRVSQSTPRGSRRQLVARVRSDQPSK